MGDVVRPAGRVLVGARTLILSLSVVAGATWIATARDPAHVLAFGVVGISMLGISIGGKGWASFPIVLEAVAKVVSAWKGRT